MTIGKAGNDRPIFPAQPEEGFTSGNATYLNKRYTDKRLERTEKTETGDVNLYVARDNKTGDDVLLKEHNEPLIDRANAELNALKAIQSPKVMRLIDAVRVKVPSDKPDGVENKMYLVFEHQPPKLEIKSEQDVWNVLSQVTQAVRDTHAAKLVHGGIKRESLFGGKERVLLGNFSASKPLGQNENATSYPGQDVRDIWKLGAEMFAGLGEKSLSNRARAFMKKANQGGGATFFHLNWEFFFANGRRVGSANTQPGDPNFVKSKP
jgi:serine/threonine protein kinase